MKEAGTSRREEAEEQEGAGARRESRGGENAVEVPGLGGRHVYPHGRGGSDVAQSRGGGDGRG